MNANLRTAIIIAVTSVWVANFAIASLNVNYHPSESINAIFMAIVGGALAIGVKEDKNGKNDKE